MLPQRDNRGTDTHQGRSKNLPLSLTGPSQNQQRDEQKTQTREQQGWATMLLSQHISNPATPSDNDGFIQRRLPPTILGHAHVRCQDCFRCKSFEVSDYFLETVIVLVAEHKQESSAFLSRTFTIKAWLVTWIKAPSFNNIYHPC